MKLAIIQKSKVTCFLCGWELEGIEDPKEIEKFLLQHLQGVHGRSRCISKEKKKTGSLVYLGPKFHNDLGIRK